MMKSKLQINYCETSYARLKKKLHYKTDKLVTKSEIKTYLTENLLVTESDSDQNPTDQTYSYI